MAYTQADIDSLKDAMASGVLSANHGGVTITYRSLREMAQALRRMEAEVNGTPGHVRHQLADFSE